MESTNIATSILRIQQLPAYQAGGQQQQSPFAQGQFLQGSVSAKSGSGQFTIDIGGQQILADSTAQLQVGQELNVQVEALIPRIELRIVDTPANRLVGNSIHFVGTQAATVAALTSLAQRADLLPQLSSTSRQTLQLFADSLAGGSVLAAASLADEQTDACTCNRLLNACDITHRARRASRLNAQTPNSDKQISVRIDDSRGAFRHLGSAASASHPIQPESRRSGPLSYRSPNLYALVGREIQRLPFFHIKGRIPRIDIAHRLRAVVTRRMPIGQYRIAKRLLAEFAPPDLRPAEEHALIRREAVERRGGMIGMRHLVGVIRGRQSSHVSNVLGKRQLAID